MLNKKNSGNQKRVTTKIHRKQIPRSLYLKPNLGLFSGFDRCSLPNQKNQKYQKYLLSQERKNVDLQPDSIHLKVSITYGGDIERGFQYLLDNLRRGLNIHRWKSLTTLNLNLEFPKPSSKNNEVWEYIFTKIFGVKSRPIFANLRNLQITINGQILIKNFGLHSEICRNLINLKQISVNPKTALVRMNQDEFKSCARAFVHYLAHLRLFELTLDRSSQIEDQGLNDLTILISRCLPLLKDFKLILTGLEEITQRGLRKLLTKIWNNGSGLESLELIIANCPKIKYSEAENILLKTFCRLANLNSLTFGFNVITKKGLEDMGLGLTKNLNKLDLNLSHCHHITPRDLDIFLSNISNSLQDIRLNFSSSQRTDKDLNIIGNGLLPIAPSLKTLDLNFFGCDQITDAGLKKFALTILPRLNDLTNLSLSFCPNLEVSENSFKIIGLNIAAHVTKLHELHLSFAGWGKIKDGGLDEVVSKISVNLVNLRQLELDFSYCDHITNNGFENIAIKIATLTNLEEVTLNGTQCPRRSPCQKKICDLLHFVRTLKVIF